MAIDDHPSLAFELILQPAALNEKLLSRQTSLELQKCREGGLPGPRNTKTGYMYSELSRVNALAAKNIRQRRGDRNLTGDETKYARISSPDPVVMAVLSDFLQQLQSCQNMTVRPDSGFATGNSHRKKSHIQSMVLQIHAFYNWDLALVQKFLPLNLQSQLLETLLCSCGKAHNVFVTNKENIGAGEALMLKDLERSTIFAVQLFLRWVLRTLPSLNDPVPPGNKIQLYSLSVAGANGGIPPDTIAQLSALRFTAVKTLEAMLPSMTSLVPSYEAFRVSPVTLETECRNDFGWINLEESAVKAQTLFDLAGYTFFVENYPTCRHYLTQLSTVKATVLKKYIDVETMDGYRSALNLDNVKEVEDDEAMADERKVNLELNAWANCSKDLGKKLSEANTLMRMKKSLPPNLEFFVQQPVTSSVLNKSNFKCQFLKGLSVPSEAAKFFNYESERPNLVEKVQKISTKYPKIRKRETLMSLLRERNPEKISKTLQELAKFHNGTLSRKIVSRWDIDEGQKGILLTLNNFVGINPRSGIINTDIEFIFILLAKLKQLIGLKSFNESPILFSSILRLAGDKILMDKSKFSNFDFKVNVQVLYLKMLQFNDNSVSRQAKVLSNNFVQQCRDCFVHLLATTTPGTVHDCLVMEEMVATLLNLGEFEFLLSRSGDNRWRSLELASYVCALVLHFRGKQALPPMEYKKTFKSLEDILINVAQSSVSGGKKSRMDAPTPAGSCYDFDKRLVTAFISKLHHLDVTDLIKAFLVSCFNSSITDSAQAIQCDLPDLAVSPKNTSSLNTDQLLSTLLDMTDSTSNGLRVRAEIHFARANYLAAMQNYLECLIVTTNYFHKPWNSSGQIPSQDWDERIFQKMIKCTSELGHHLQTAVLCQFSGGSGSDCDYATAFRSLEERNSSDAMDELYDFIWDVTLLEYIVSMHAKRGELSRKRRALDIISRVEININNNEEILREARASRRSRFLRHLCSVFL